MIATLLVAASIVAQEQAVKPTAETVHPYPIKTKYDRIRDESLMSVDLGRIIVEGNGVVLARIRAYASWDKQDRPSLKDDETITFYVSHAAPEWRLLKSHDIAILADSIRLTPDSEHDGEVTDSGVRERVSFDLKLSDLRAVGKVERVEVAIGAGNFSLEPRQIAALRDMAAMLSVPTEESDKIAFDIQAAQKARMQLLQEAMDRAVEKARATVKALPRARRATEANRVGMAKTDEEFSPTEQKYGVTSDERAELRKAYPEFQRGDEPARPFN